MPSAYLLLFALNTMSPKVYSIMLVLICPISFILHLLFLYCNYYLPRAVKYYSIFLEDRPPKAKAIGLSPILVTIYRGRLYLIHYSVLVNLSNLSLITS